MCLPTHPSHRIASDQGQKVCSVERRMCSSIVREGCRKAELQGGCGMLAVEAIDGCCCRWLFVVQPAQPTQLANPAERRLVGCRRPTVEARQKHHAVGTLSQIRLVGQITPVYGVAQT
jgi:hypothetical protein